MPLYIDYHGISDDYTLEELRQDHKADLAVSGKYGIRHIQYWLNREGNTVYCLLEGPSPESCHACHFEACGETACNIQEVEPLHLKLFMGEELRADEHDMILAKNGKADTGNRTILVCDIQGIDQNNSTGGYQPQLFSAKVKNFMVDYITRLNGRFLENNAEEAVVGIFDSPTNAIKCAKNIQGDIGKLRKKHGENSEWDIEFRISLNIGQPLEPEGGFFEAPIKQGKRLCMIAKPNQVILTSRLKELLEMETEASTYTGSPFSSKVLTKPEEHFIYQLFELTEENIHQENFNVNTLCKLIGQSRPQLYRKITSLTGRSPYQFIKEFRMKRAWQLVKANKGNISEIAFEIGYANHSHFTRTFRENFGYTPSELRTSLR
jgi:AraC-like DNA-binding protein